MIIFQLALATHQIQMRGVSPAPSSRKKEERKERKGKAIAGLVLRGVTITGGQRGRHRRMVRAVLRCGPLLLAARYCQQPNGMQKEGMPCVRRHTLGLSERQTRE
jgi:hypothetical protein